MRVRRECRRADLAQAGGPHKDRLPAALQEAFAVIAKKARG